MCGAGLLFPVMSGFAKFLGESGYNSLQVSWARAFGHIVFMLAFFVPRFGLRMLRTRRPLIQLLRSSCCSAPTPPTSSPLPSFRWPRPRRSACGAVARGAARPADPWRAHDGGADGGALRGFAGVLIIIRPGTSSSTGLAVRSRQRCRLRGLPGADAAHRRHRSARDLDDLQLRRGWLRHVPGAALRLADARESARYPLFCSLG